MYTHVETVGLLGLQVLADGLHTRLVQHLYGLLYLQAGRLTLPLPRRVLPDRAQQLLDRI